MTEGTTREYRETPGTCADCGNSPVNHFEEYCLQTLAVMTARETSGRKKGALRAFADRIAEWIEPKIYAFFGALPIASFGTNPADACTYRSQVIWEEAHRRGIEMEQLFLFGKPTEIYRACRGSSHFYFNSLPVPPVMERGKYPHIDDKFLLKRFLAGHGIPVPASISVTKEADALDALDELGAPLVVKPRIGSRGRHTTVHLTDAAELRRAFRSAKRLCRYVAVEEYLPGPVCRATLVDGVLVGFFKAEAPRVVGDGRSTIDELIAAANASKPDRVGDIVLSDEHERFIARFGFARTDVLPHGHVLTLTHRTGRLFGGRTRELIPTVHPRLRASLERAAQLLAAPVLGFDLIIAEPEADPDAQRWGIIEGNSLPFIDLHYLPLEGEPVNVASCVWNLGEQALD